MRLFGLTGGIGSLVLAVACGASSQGGGAGADATTQDAEREQPGDSGGVNAVRDATADAAVSPPANYGEASADADNSDHASADGPAGSPDSGFPPLAPNEDVANLTSPQLGLLCDWSNAELGGYGTVTPCGTMGASSVANASDQADCITYSFKFRCSVTVGEVEACILAQAPSRACDFPPACNSFVCQ